MAKEETLFLSTGQELKGTELSQMFGKPCFKTNGKAFMCFFENCMVFKLSGAVHQEALGLAGSQLFDPSGRGRAMKEWVQVTYAHHQHWARFARAALAYVKA